MKDYLAFILFAVLCLGLVYCVFDRPHAKPVLIEATPASMYACSLRPVRDIPAESAAKVNRA